MHCYVTSRTILTTRKAIIYTYLFNGFIRLSHIMLWWDSSQQNSHLVKKLSGGGHQHTEFWHLGSLGLSWTVLNPQRYLLQIYSMCFLQQNNVCGCLDDRRYVFTNFHGWIEYHWTSVNNSFDLRLLLTKLHSLCTSQPLLCKTIKMMLGLSYLSGKLFSRQRRSISW